MYEIECQLRFEDFVFAYGTLDKNNRWVKMADILDWDKIEVVYAKKFVKNGNRAKNVRMALGSLIIKQTLNCSDVETVNQICENPYLQYFIGLKEYTDVAPFTSQSMTEFRKRFSEGEILKFINELIIGDKNSDKTAHKISDKTSIKKTQNTTIKPPEKVDTSTGASIAAGDKNDDMPLQPATTIASGDNVQPEDDSPCMPNYRALAIDATCAPADIAFPQDILLLNLRVKRLKFLLTSCTKKASQRSL